MHREHLLSFYRCSELSTQLSSWFFFCEIKQQYQAFTPMTGAFCYVVSCTNTASCSKRWDAQAQWQCDETQVCDHTLDHVHLQVCSASADSLGLAPILPLQQSMPDLVSLILWGLSLNPSTGAYCRRSVSILKSQLIQVHVVSDWEEQLWSMDSWYSQLSFPLLLWVVITYQRPMYGSTL